MARKKVKLQFISNIVKRKATFRRRWQGLLKKAHELSTLCDVKVCLIVYEPDEAVPMVWPSISDAARVLRTLKETPWIDQSRNTMNQEAFTKSMIGKLENQVMKMDREIAEMEMDVFMNDCLAGRQSLECTVVGVKELTILTTMVEKKLNEVKGKMAARDGNMVDEWLTDYISNGTENQGFSSMNAAYASFGNPLHEVLNPTAGNYNLGVDAFSYFSMN